MSGRRCHHCHWRAAVIGMVTITLNTIIIWRSWKWAQSPPHHHRQYYIQPPIIIIIVVVVVIIIVVGRHHHPPLPCQCHMSFSPGVWGELPGWRGVGWMEVWQCVPLDGTWRVEDSWDYITIELINSLPGCFRTWHATIDIFWFWWQGLWSDVYFQDAFLKAVSIPRASAS